jgi:soluble lytic murein transglycosylase
MNAIAGPSSTLEGDDGSQAYAEAWLGDWIAAEDDETNGARLSDPPAVIAEDPDLAAARFLLDVDARGDALLAAGRLYEHNKEDPRSLYALSLLFEEMGLYRLSMISMARLLEFSPARLVEDAPVFLQKRVYPQPFADLIVREAEANGLDPLLYFSLIRQESQFEEGARSAAAAQGLAQIIPDTGHWVAAQLGHPDYSNEQIYLPYVNLRFGAYYLGWARDYLDGNLISALVGYNAGPGNAHSWRERYGDDDPWYIERLDFNEPRVYVQTILQNLYHYNRLYTQTP